jgi:uncharacterized membrane protein
MENLIVITFQNAQNATDGLNRLKELDALNDITIYNIALIRKTGDAQFELLHRDGPDTTDFPATGAVTGVLIGVIAGPVGMAIGMMTGTMFGFVEEDTTEGFYTDLMGKVKDRLSTGTFAIVMDVEEDNEVMINSYMESYNGVTGRAAITDMVDDYDREQQAELDREIAAEEDALKNALGEDKAAIKEKIEKLREARDKQMAKYKARADKKGKFLKERIMQIDQKIKAAEEKAKEKLEIHEQKLKDKLSKLKASL